MVTTLANDLVLRAARRERTPRTPVWMMRQAGRFDPEYRRVRDACGLPLETMFRTPEIATEISLLPRRFGVDAIIFYQDILTPLAPLGADFVFRPGPTLDDPPRTVARLRGFMNYDVAAELPFVAATLNMVKRELDGTLPLLGFAGAPFTLAAFLIEGHSPAADMPEVRRVMHAEPAALHALLAVLADMTADYLAYQLEQGADAVQLFESLADRLTPDEYRVWAHPYHERVFGRLNTPAPTILYAKDQPLLALQVTAGATVLGVGTGVDLADAIARYGDRVAFQGNVDNELVATGTLAEIDAAVTACVRAGRHCGHILNLSHGVLKDTPFENGCRVIETCKKVVCDVDNCDPLSATR